jgi:hypothetical protein
MATLGWRGASLTFVVAATLAGVASAQTRSVVTFDELTHPERGFNGQVNRVMTTADGEYRIEYFWLHHTSHTHKFAGQERNHNHAHMVRCDCELQGLRITRVDGQPFDVVSMDLYRQAAVGHLDERVCGGDFELWEDTSGTVERPATVSFRDRHHGVTAIDFVDPLAAGGRMGTTDGADPTAANVWDNITLSHPATQRAAR